MTMINKNIFRNNLLNKIDQTWWETFHESGMLKSINTIMLYISKNARRIKKKAQLKEQENNEAKQAHQFGILLPEQKAILNNTPRTIVEVFALGFAIVEAFTTIYWSLTTHYMSLAAPTAWAIGVNIAVICVTLLIACTAMYFIYHVISENLEKGLLKQAF